MSETSITTVLIGSGVVLSAYVFFSTSTVVFVNYVLYGACCALNYVWLENLFPTLPRKSQIVGFNLAVALFSIVEPLFFDNPESLLYYVAAKVVLVVGFTILIVKLSEEILSPAGFGNTSASFSPAKARREEEVIKQEKQRHRSSSGMIDNSFIERRLSERKESVNNAGGEAPTRNEEEQQQQQDAEEEAASYEPSKRILDSVDVNEEDANHAEVETKKTKTRDLLMLKLVVRILQQC